MIGRDSLLIGGRMVSSTSSERVDVISPITDEVIGRVPAATTGDVDAAVASARQAFDEGPWPRLSVRERGEILLDLADRLVPRLDEVLRLQTDEMGAPFWFMKRFFDVRAIVREQLDVALAVRERDERMARGRPLLVVRQPVGVVGVIHPWNGPAIGLIGKMLPPLLTGCTAVVKPPIESPLSPLAVADVIASAGLPPGVISVIPGGPEVGEHLVTHPGVDKIAFTGSSAVGRRIGARCGELVRPVTLELGGKSAAIVLDDADLDAHLPALLAGSMSNNGQICYSTTRILVSERRAGEVTDRLVGAIRSLTVGDPHDEGTDVGPVASARQRDRVVGYIRDGMAAGARLACGGPDAPHERGCYVTPTLFADVDNSMRIAREEIFGPVLCLIHYRDVDDAVRIANDSEYGLGGAVFTADVERGLAVAMRIRTGSVAINDGAPGGGGGPFGGVKQSGIGRERGVEGYEGYYDLKSVGLPARV